MEPFNYSLYKSLLDSYISAHSNLKYSVAEGKVAEIWKQFRNSDGFPMNVKVEIEKLKEKAAKSRGSLLQFWSKIPQKKKQPEDDATEPTRVSEPGTSGEIFGVAEEKFVEKIIPATGEPVPVDGDYRPQKNDKRIEIACRTPAQNELRKQIQDLQQDIVYLSNKKERGLATELQIEELRIKRLELKTAEKSLSNLVQTQERQQRKRQRDKQLLNDNPDLAALLNRGIKKGKRRIEKEQPELLKAIAKIASYGSAVDDRRRSEMLRTAMTFDDLKEELSTMGYNISRSALYLRLLPKRANTFEGKRHVVTVPVKLLRSSNDAHKEHSDWHFCKTSISYLEDIASTLGNDQVLFVSQDDKARVPIGITAANKQAPTLMHLDYRVRLPDHDWVVAERHKLIPSVYALLAIKQSNIIGETKCVGYSGPTFIAIRSGKHSSSTAYSHAKDFDTLVNLHDTCTFTRCRSGDVKPIVIMTVDGGPDENPRYEKVVNTAVRHFKKYDLDALFIATNAPGRSAYNKVERRMAPLSKELAGIILPYDTFGSHLDDQRRTIDSELEIRNFSHAGKALTEIRSNVSFDGFNTTAVYVDPEDSEITDVESTSAEWKTRHVRESHYFLQVVKCSDPACCLSPRGNYFSVFPRFIPGPIFLNQETMLAVESEGPDNKFCSLFLRLRIDDSKLKRQNSEVPFDLCCPSIQELVPSRTCTTCGLYFASVKSLRNHQKGCLKTDNVEKPGKISDLHCRRLNRPLRVAARRQQERMVVWTSRLNDEHCDWFDEDELIDIPTNDMTTSTANEMDLSLPVASMETHMSSPWTTDHEQKY